MRKTIKNATLAGLLMLAPLFAAPAEASPVYVKANGLGVYNLEIMAPFYFRGFAGQVLLDTGSAGPEDDFVGWCVDATRSREMAQDMTIRPLSELPDHGNPSSSVQPNAGSRIAWLINTYSNDAWLLANNILDDADNRAAALQLAIWEVLYTPFGYYDIASGDNFRLVWASLYPSIVAYGNLYFSALGNNTDEAIWYDNSDKTLSTGQDFAVDPVTTPEPASVLLFGSGLIGLARYARRRRRQ